MTLKGVQTRIIRAAAGLAIVITASPVAAQRSQHPIVPVTGDTRMIDATSAMPQIGELLPGFEAVFLSGDLINADSLIGSPYVVAIWSTDCPGSRQALRGLQSLSDSLGDRGVQFLVLATDTSRVVLGTFVEQHGVRLPIAQIAPDQTRAFVRSRRVGPDEPYQVVFSKPSFLLTDEEGIILARDGGGLRDDFISDVHRIYNDSSRRQPGH